MIPPILLYVILFQGSTDFRTAWKTPGDSFEDLIQAGIVDPTKVVRTAIQNASSIATLLLTTDAMIGKVPEKKKAPAMPAGGGGYGGYGDMY